MPRLIDADALMRDIDSDVFNTESQKCYEKMRVREQPTIDAEPVRHGRWELETSKYLRRCSACEKVTFYCGAGRHYDYCPNCGAKMDLEG